MTNNEPEFEYTNLSHRPAGRFIRLSTKFSKRIRTVQEQIVPYAQAWKAANAAALQQKGPLWVVLGDSMAQGIGASRYDQGWVGQLHSVLQKVGRDYRVINLSVSGARVEDVLDRQLPAMRKLGTQPALVTVLIGSNDMISKKHRQHLPVRYQKLLAQLPVGTYIASPFGDSGQGAILNKLIVEQSRNHGLVVATNDLGGNISSWRGKLAEDHFHPNDAGYAGLADTFYQTIKLDFSKQ